MKIETEEFQLNYSNLDEISYSELYEDCPYIQLEHTVPNVGVDIYNLKVWKDIEESIIINYEIIYLDTIKQEV